MPEIEPVPDLPEPTAELMLIQALVRAHVRRMGKKERELFLADVAEGLGSQEASVNVLRFRLRPEERAVVRVIRQARCLWTALRPD